jgi:hypothetical protein
VCCTTSTRPITETAKKHKEHTNVHAETTACRPIKEEKEATKTQASQKKHKTLLQNKDEGDKIKILKEENTKSEVNSGPFKV